MFCFNGRLTYRSGPRHGDTAQVDLLIGFFPPSINIAIHDNRYDSIHKLINSRFNFQSRDSYVGLLARDAWETDWIDFLEGDLHLVMPAIQGVSHALEVSLHASWWPAFAVIEFRQGADYCQIATRPRANLNSRWFRADTEPSQPPRVVRPQPLNSEIGQRANHTSEPSESSASSHPANPEDSTNVSQPIEANESDPDCPFAIDYARIVYSP